MLKPLRDTPTFVETDFRDRISPWKQAGLEAGHRVCIEWLTGENTGPHVFVYPAGHRALGVEMLQRKSLASVDERWADFLEFEYIPKIAAALEQDGYRPDVMCVDLRPVVVQRQRRRQIEAAARAKAGAAGH